MKAKKRAWLITWDWSLDMDRREPKVVAILDARFEHQRILHMLHALFIQGEPLTNEEKLYFGQPLPKISQLIHPTPYGIRFGLKPELYARIVSNLWLESHSDTSETVHWTEPDVYRLNTDLKRELICPTYECSWRSNAE